MVDIKLYAAPMEGLTTYIWRRAQREVFGGVDKYFTPFLSPNGNLAFQQKELDEVTQGETDTVPQLLTNRGDYFVWAARELYAMGVREVNFNLGCPSGTVTAKRKGAGLLAYPEELDRCLEEVFAALPDMRVSIKTRIGKNDPAEWERLLAIYGKYPVSELIVHPRVQKEFYRGAVHRDAFELALARRREPPVYNGDLFTAAEVEDFCRLYPQVRAVMLGRGLVADPALGRRLRGGAAATRQELEALLPRFTGEVMQVPPMYSAIKINGQKLYQLARQGKEVERPARPVTIHELEVLGQDESGDWLLRILCSKGTYVRTLCHDMGQALGCGGCMSSLRRTMAAGFTLADSHTIEEVQELGEALLAPADSLFRQYPAYVIPTEGAEQRCRCGNPLTAEVPDGLYRVYGRDGSFLCLSRGEGGVLTSLKNFFGA